MEFRFPNSLPCVGHDLGPILNFRNKNLVLLLSSPDGLTGRFNIHARSFMTGHLIKRAESILAIFFEKRGFLEKSALIQNDKFHGCRCCGNTVQSRSWRVSAC